jgi:hypothetical protein
MSQGTVARVRMRVGNVSHWNEIATALRASR